MNLIIIVNICLGIWVYIDSKKRLCNEKIWGPITAIVGILAASFWLAKRPLKDGEIREGGIVWNFMKYFSVMWTIICFLGFLYGMHLAVNDFDKYQDKYQKAGTAIGASLGGAVIFGFWFIVISFCMVIGFFLKKNSIIEKGPTGSLAVNDKQIPKSNI